MLKLDNCHFKRDTSASREAESSAPIVESLIPVKSAKQHVFECQNTFPTSGARAQRRGKWSRRRAQYIAQPANSGLRSNPAAPIEADISRLSLESGIRGRYPCRQCHARRNAAGTESRALCQRHIANFLPVHALLDDYQHAYPHMRTGRASETCYACTHSATSYLRRWVRVDASQVA